MEHKPAKGSVVYEIRFSLKNVSDKPVTICDYAGNRPLAIAWTGPDGTTPKSNHYAWVAKGFLPELMKNNFLTLPPGGVRFIGPRGQYSGVWFQGQPSPQVNQAHAGQHRVAARYANKDDGAKFGLKDVWTGTVTANEVSLTVK